LKTPWRNGTTHVIFEPLDFISRLVSLVPQPRVNLTRFHGIFAPNSKYRALVTPARRGKCKEIHSADKADQTPVEKRISMNWLLSYIPVLRGGNRRHRRFNPFRPAFCVGVLDEFSTNIIHSIALNVST
jgi:hypothetical protein